MNEFCCKKINIFRYIIYSYAYRRRCATNAGPYQSPGCFPELSPRETKVCIDRGLFREGLSPNHLMIIRCNASFVNPSRLRIGCSGVHLQPEKSKRFGILLPPIWNKK